MNSSVEYRVVWDRPSEPLRFGTFMIVRDKEHGASVLGDWFKHYPAANGAMLQARTTGSGPKDWKEIQRLSLMEAVTA